MRLLLVEDDAMIGAAAREGLRQEGHAVDWVRDGAQAEAAAALDQDFYDVVVADTALAGLSGDDAAKLLRSHIAKDAGSVHLVAASLDHSPAYRKAKLAAGFDGTIAKPFRREDLLSLLKGQREPTRSA